MDKLHIASENLCIKNIVTVIKNHITKNHKTIEVKGRHSDAFVYVISGSCKYVFDDGIEFTASRGDVFYLPCGSVYKMFVNAEDYRFIFCDFEFMEARAVGEYFETPPNMEVMFTKLLNLYRSYSPNKYTECMSVLYGIYSILQQTTEREYLSKNKKNMIADAKRFMEENFSNSEIEIPGLAERLMMSDVYFRKLFKNQYGVSPLKYLNSLRLKNAMSLMKLPFLSLEECAKQSGFSSLQYFCRLFKKELGISPGKYRSQISG